MPVNPISPVATFPVLYNNWTGSVAAAYTAGSSTLTVADASALSSFPIRLTCFAGSDSTQLPTYTRFHLQVTGKTGNVLNVATIDTSAQVNLAVGNVVRIAVSAETLAEMQAAIIATQNYLNSAISALNGLLGTVGTPLQASNNLSDLASAATARTNLGLGTASTYAATAFDASGAASSAITTVEAWATANLSPVAGSTSITTLGTINTGTWHGSSIAVAYLGTGTAAAGKYLDGAGAWTTLPASLLVANNLSDLASAATARTNLGLGTAATFASTAFDAAGAAAAVLPTQTGNSGKFLTTNGTTVSWATPSGGGGGSPGGSTNSIQYNSSGAFAGSNYLVVDATNYRIGIGVTTPAASLDISDALQVANTVGSTLPLINIATSEPSGNVDKFNVYQYRTVAGNDWTGVATYFTRSVDGNVVSGFSLNSGSGSTPSLTVLGYTGILGNIYAGIYTMPSAPATSGNAQIQINGYGESFVCWGYDRYSLGYGGAGQINIGNQTGDTVLINYGAYGWRYFTSHATQVGYLDSSGNWTITGAVAGGTVSPASLSANTNNYAPGAGGFQRWTSSAAINVTGMAAGLAGEVRRIINVGTNTITLTNQDSNSTAANRWLTTTGASLALAANKIALAVYDATTAAWRVSLLP